MIDPGLRAHFVRAGDVNVLLAQSDVEGGVVRADQLGRKRNLPFAAVLKLG